MSCGNRNVSVIAGQGVFQLFYLLKGQLCALCNLPHSKFKDLRLRLRLIGTSFSLPLFLSMFFYSFFQLGRIQHIILNHQDVHILVVCMAFLRKAYSTAARHRFNQSEYTLPAILSHFDCCLQYCLYKKGIFSLAIHQRHGLALPVFLWFLSQYALPVFYRLPNKR